MRKYAENIIGVTLAIIGLTVTLFFAGCNEPGPKERHANYVYSVGVPSGARNIAILENGWYTFEWRDECFLASRTRGTAGAGLLTRVECK